LAWSLDTQELFIGNGSVAEGSPAVGNTKILTERDLTAQGNLLNLIQHIYKVNDPAIQTGASPNSPISRQVQTRLDDLVFSANFGTIADGAADDTSALQRAINQLFLNPSSVASLNNADGVQSRVTLQLAPGIYRTTSTLYIPSYTTIAGAGSGKTIIEYTGVGPAIELVNDNSTPGNPSILGNTASNEEPRNISISGLTVNVRSNNQHGLVLNAVKDSKFYDLSINGNWDVDPITNSNSKGILLNAVSSIVTCDNNIFEHVDISNFSYAVYSDQDIINNRFNIGYITNVRQGFVLGQAATGTAVGEQYGPRQTLIAGYKFENVKRHAVYVGLGSGNAVNDCYLADVGNDGAGVFFPEYPQIYFDTVGNSCNNIQSDRDSDLSSLTFTIDLTLSNPINGNKGDEVSQVYLVTVDDGTGPQQVPTTVIGLLKENYPSDNTITVVMKGTTPFVTGSNISIAGNSSPGVDSTITITETTTTAFITATTTNKLDVGSSISFSGTVFGGIEEDVTYYVSEVFDDTSFIVSETLGGSSIELVPALGTMTGSYNPISSPTVVSLVSSVPYIGAVAGFTTFNSFTTNHVNINYAPATAPFILTLLPIPTTSLGVPTRSVTFKIDYVYRSLAYDFTRQGTLVITADVDASVSIGSSSIQVSDEYTFTRITESQAVLLNFTASLLNQNGGTFSGGTDIPHSIALRYSNDFIVSSVADQGTFAYTYSVIL
jgi:hypothetical protein